VTAFHVVSYHENHEQVSNITCQDATNTLQHWPIQIPTLTASLMSTFFLPLLQSMHNFMQFAQKCDVFVFNYLASIKICQANVYAMYKDPTTTYTHD